MHEMLRSCALEGCGVLIPSREGSGRPRLYCSDAHRAEARRRRLGVGAGPGPDDPVEALRGLLAAASGQLERLQVAVGARDEAALAEVRARATAEVLASQQLAADATRQAAADRSALEDARREWAEAERAYSSRHAEDASRIEELTGALEGARAELEEELLGHHADLDALERRRQAEAAGHAAELRSARAAADELRDRLAAAGGALAEAERRCTAADAALERARAKVVSLEVRAARAEEQARQAQLRSKERDAELRRCRTELSTARRGGGGRRAGTAPARRGSGDAAVSR